MSLGWAIIGGLAFGPLGFIGGCFIGNDDKNDCQNCCQNYCPRPCQNYHENYDEYTDDQLIRDLERITERCYKKNDYDSIDEVLYELDIPSRHQKIIKSILQEK